MIIVTLPKALLEKLGDAAAEGLVEVLNRYGEENEQRVLDSAEKDFKSTLVEESGLIRGEIGDFKVQLRSETSDMATQLRSEMGEMTISLREEMRRMEQSLRADMAELEKSLRADMAELEKSLRADMAELEKSLRSEIAELKIHVEKRLTEEISSVREGMAKNQSNTIKWMFLFWAGQIGVITGILFAFFQ